MSEWVTDESMYAWKAIQDGKVTGDVQLVMAALDEGNRRLLAANETIKELSAKRGGYGEEGE